MSKYKIILMYAITFLLAFFLLHCEPEEFMISPLELAKYLELNEIQETKLMPVFEEIEGIFKEYYSGKKKSTVTGQRAADDELDEEWVTTLDKAYKLMKTIPDEMNPQQKMLWRQTKLYRLFIYERGEILKKLRDINTEEYRTKVAPSLEPELVYKEYPGDKEIYKKWKVTFGSGYGIFTKKINMASVDKRGRYSFPAAISALLLDPKIVEYEFRQKYPDRRDEWNSLRKEYLAEVNPDNNILIRLSLYSALHPKFTDIYDWIVYIENDNGVQIEPLKIEEHNVPWDYFNTEEDLPDFLKMRGMQRAEMTERSMDGPERITGNTERIQQPAERGQVGFAPAGHYRYYLLFFPREVSGDAVINGNVKYLRLVFLKDIGSPEKAEGMWYFIN